MKLNQNPFEAIRRIEKARRSIQGSLSQFEKARRSIQGSLSQFEKARRAHLVSIDVIRRFEVSQRDVQRIKRDIDQSVAYIEKNRNAMRRALQDIDCVRQAYRRLR